MTKIFPWLVLVAIVALVGPLVVDHVGGLTIDVAVSTGATLEGLK